MLSPQVLSRVYNFESHYHKGRMYFNSNDDDVDMSDEEIQRRKNYFRTLPSAGEIPADDASLSSNDSHHFDYLVYYLFYPNDYSPEELAQRRGPLVDGTIIYRTVHQLYFDEKITGYDTYSSFRLWLFRRLTLRERRTFKNPNDRKSSVHLMHEVKAKMNDMKIQYNKSDVTAIFEKVRDKKYRVTEDHFEAICEAYSYCRLKQPLYQAFLASCKRIKSYRYARREKMLDLKLDNELIEAGIQLPLYNLRSKVIYKRYSVLPLGSDLFN